MVSATDGFAIVQACTMHDLPSRASPPSWSIRGPGEAVECHLGCLDGEPVGYLQLSLPQRDNLDTMDVDLRVLPAFRRRGPHRLG
jgi:hypothetical protein